MVQGLIFGLAFVSGASVTVAIWLLIERLRAPQERVSEAARLLGHKGAQKSAGERLARTVKHLDSFGSYASPRVARLRAMVEGL